MIQVDVESIYEDGQTSEVEAAATYQMRLRAEGEAQSADGGCVASNGGASALALLLFAGLGLLGVRRRRA